MELQLQDINGRVVGEVPVSQTLFGAPFNASLVHQALVMYQLNRRQGTHKVKVRSEVSGGGAKPWRQKHTGRARHGSIRSPIWRHGGVTFGPHPRSYRRAMPKRMRHLALRCVLSQKLEAGRVVLVQDFDSITGRTRDMVQALKNLKTTGSTLLVTAAPESNVIRSSRNIPRLWTLPANLLNAGELLKRGNLILTLDSLRRAEELWGEGADAVQVLPVGTFAAEQEALEEDEPQVIAEPLVEETPEPAEASLDEDLSEDSTDADSESDNREGEA
jgi:large subunit ribosomal protein L4